jgi:hypothetical protein
VPYGTDSQLDVFQAMNCLATIVESLRDRISRHVSQPISIHRLATSIVQPNRRLVPHLFSYLPDPFSFLDVPWHIHNRDAIHAFH